MITRTPAESVYIYTVVHHSLIDPFVPTHRRRARRKGSVLSLLSTLVLSH